jgi:hypothetical protein
MEDLPEATVAEIIATIDAPPNMVGPEVNKLNFTNFLQSAMLVSLTFQKQIPRLTVLNLVTCNFSNPETSVLSLIILFP